MGNIDSTQHSKKLHFYGTFDFGAVVLGTLWHIWRIFRKKSTFSILNTSKVIEQKHVRRHYN